VDLVEIEADYFPNFDQLRRGHTLEHIERTLLDGQSGEWEGTRRDLGKTALRMAGGTILAAEALLQGRAHTAVNFAGAKHHAMREHSSGFCVFNDFAIAAHYVLGSKREIYRPISKKMSRVRRIAIFDMDAHHGDGTEELLQDSFRIFTMSVHDSSIFPGTGKYDEPDFHCFNRPLEPGSGDQALDSAASGLRAFSLSASCRT
jgi:Deacetylases, including yeast histone deacetylase and acetoin utilization protein